MFGTPPFYLGHVGRVPIYVAFEAIFMVLFVWVFPLLPGIDGFLFSLFGLVLAILLHELGHAFAAIARGMGGVSILIGAMGGVCRYQGDTRPSRVLPITVAGVAVNFTVAAACWLTLQHAGIENELALKMLHCLFWWNFLLGCFNSLPIYPLDGGSAVLHVSQLVARSERTAKSFTLALTMLTAVVVLGLWGINNGRLDLWLIMLVIMLLMQAFRDLR